MAAFAAAGKDLVDSKGSAADKAVDRKDQTGKAVDRKGQIDVAAEVEPPAVEAASFRRLMAVSRLLQRLRIAGKT
jgi:hypothetical protein